MPPKRYYHKEEAFADEYSGWAWAVSKAVDGAWKPNTLCNDSQRQQNEYFMKTGQMTWLVFTSASTHTEPEGEFHAQVILESSSRVVNVRATTRDGKAVAEVKLDRAK
jgi:hypothetical protein